MSNFYLCDICRKKSSDVSDTECICWAARVKKVIVMDDEERPLKDICPYELFEERDDQ